MKLSEMSNNKRIEMSNIVYPVFSALTGELLFWGVINTIFLTEVKKFNAAQISSLAMFGNLVAILLYPIAFRIIKKFGNVLSVKLGTRLFLCASILLTFSNKYSVILLGYILYTSASVFKSMDNVILRKNLKYLNRENDYIKIQNKASFIHSFFTMLVAFSAGFLFNTNNYLPMILCVVICSLNVMLSDILYENQNTEVKENIERKTKNKLSITKIIFLIVLLYGTLYSTIDLGKDNSKLFIQYNLSSFLTIDKVSIVLSFIVAISRIVRVISNYFFAKYCKGEDKKVLYKIGYILMFGFIFIILGSLIKSKNIGIILMSLGFFGFLSVCDFLKNYMQTLLLNICKEEYYEQAITYLALSRKVGKFFLSTLITLLLFKIDMLYIMILLLGISIFNILIIKKVYNILKY